MDGDADCRDLSGAYISMGGSCSEPSFRFPEAICVRQRACTATIFGTDMVRLDGTIVGAKGTFTTETPVPQSCTAEQQADGSASIRCDAASVGISCDGTDKPQALEGVTESCCDVMNQDCADPALRCQPIRLTDKYLATGCIAVTGGKKLGESCERTAVGLDECAKGLFCARWGVVGAGRVCRALCDSESACGAGEVCADLGSVPRAGVCVTPCAPFVSPSTCPNGGACHDLQAAMDPLGAVPMTFCAATGAGVEGASCTATTDCADGTRCMSGACRALCDQDHPCSSGKSCTPFFFRALAPLDASFGWCE